jgi:hypothetical protein
VTASFDSCTNWAETANGVMDVRSGSKADIYFRMFALPLNADIGRERVRALDSIRVADSTRATPATTAGKVEL